MRITVCVLCSRFVRNGKWMEQGQRCYTTSIFLVSTTEGRQQQQTHATIQRIRKPPNIGAKKNGRQKIETGERKKNVLNANIPKKNIWIMDHGRLKRSCDSCLKRNLRPKRRNIRKARQCLSRLIHNYMVSNRKGVNAYWCVPQVSPLFGVKAAQRSETVKESDGKLQMGKQCAEEYTQSVSLCLPLNRPEKNQEENPLNKRKTFFWIFKLRNLSLFGKKIKNRSNRVRRVARKSIFSCAQYSRKLPNVMAWDKFVPTSVYYWGSVRHTTSALLPLLLLLLYK